MDSLNFVTSFAMFCPFLSRFCYYLVQIFIKGTSMEKNIFAILFAVGCSLASVDVSSFSSGSLNLSIPNIQLKNSGEEIAGFKIYYYFSAADSKSISIESYYLAGGSAKLEKLSENQYRVEFDYSDTVLGREESFPSDGYLQFGLHYSDWSL